MAYSLDSSKDSCYPGTTVLVNKLGLQEQADLDAAERVAVAVHAVEIETAPPSGPFTFAYYLDLHRRLFQDLYNWAGTLRTINLSKKGTAFYPASELAELGEAKFRRLQSQHEFRGLTRSAFIAAIADFYHELNMLHPFREGNGRSTRIWLDLLLKAQLHQVVNWSRVDKEDYLLAMERSPIRDTEIKHILKNALTDEIDSRDVYMKGIDHSYYYEGYTAFKAEEL